MSRQMTLSVGLSDHACFDNYFSGDNAEAIQAIKNLIDERSGQLALFGPAGSGKTHLLYAAQKMSMAAAQRATYFTMSDEQMLLQFGGFDDLGELVCVDNIELAAGNNPLERLLFNLIEQTSQAGRALLTACDRPLAECAFLMAGPGEPFAKSYVLPVAPADRQPKGVSHAVAGQAAGFRPAGRGDWLRDEALAQGYGGPVCIAGPDRQGILV